MIFEDENMILNVNTEETKLYYGRRLRLEGAKMENFALQVKEFAPQLSLYLEEFGIDPAKPDELCWCWKDERGQIHYNVAYTVTGEIEKSKKNEMILEDRTKLHIVLEDKYIPNEQTKPYFGFTVYNITMPWILEVEYCQEEKTEEQTILDEISKKIKKYWTKLKK